jgi:hypothetical protein
MEQNFDKIARELFKNEEGSTFAVLDGASVPDLLDTLDREKPEYECLYRGELAPDLAAMAPYLVRLEPESPFASWIIRHGWGNHWGIFALSSSDLRTLRQHFRRFLTVHDGETGKPLLFRYYDPRVLRVYLPTCNAEELTAIFGPVSSFVQEGEDPVSSLRFHLANGSLATVETKLSKET